MPKISNIISGTMGWGSWGHNLNLKEMENLIKTCYELGINTFDHADIYGGYTTEGDFGKAFLNSGINRSDVFFISKCGIQYPSEKRKLALKYYDYSKEYIIKSVETSIKYLNADYLDLILLHRPSPLMNTNEIASAIDHLKNQGKIKAFGVSNFEFSQIELLKSNCEIELNQIEFSLTNNKSAFNGLFDYLLTNKIKAMAWSPLGTYFKSKDEKSKRIKKVLKPLMEKYDASEDQLLLAWIMNHPLKISPVIGTTNKERIKAAIESLNINMEKSDWFSLLVASQGHKVP